MFGKSSKSLETEVAGLVFPNPVGVPYSLKKHRFSCFHRAPKAGFFLLTPPKENVLPWIKGLESNPGDALLVVNINTDIVRTFSLVYDFAHLLVIAPDSDNGIDATDLADTVDLLEELVSLRLCYERYTPVFLRLSHGSTPEELHTLLDTCQLSGVDGVVVPTLSMFYKVRELTLGRVPVICQIQDVEEGLMALHEGVSLLEAKPGFKGLSKLLKKLEKQ
ncbi:MAG: hypothetical protein IK074_08875 [Bacteroidales bacterium]|nr:hypothetical protein [Bacteroidales bacterium]